MSLLDMTPDQARRFNDSVPFSRDGNLPAKPFRYAGSAADRESALACLASAAWYEAGDDQLGQQAVVQVVLNRLRHPAFPKTICGVVFQGSERKTGCQFTFTCDGSLSRAPAADPATRARAIAEKALSGYVFKPVGTATHYHTDWVVPYWYDTLDKITMVHTQIFYRWKGWWGTPAAFSRKYEVPEAIEPRIAAFSRDFALVPQVDDAPSLLPLRAAEVSRPALSIDGVSLATLKGNIVRLADPTTGTYVLQLDPGAYPGSYAVVANAICKRQQLCSVIGWINPDRIPAALPIRPTQRLSATFAYRQGQSADVQLLGWNCQIILRDDQSQCLPGTGQGSQQQAPAANRR